MVALEEGKNKMSAKRVTLVIVCPASSKKPKKPFVALSRELTLLDVVKRGMKRVGYRCIPGSPRSLAVAQQFKKSSMLCPTFVKISAQKRAKKQQPKK